MSFYLVTKQCAYTIGCAPSFGTWNPEPGTRTFSIRVGTKRP